MSKRYGDAWRTRRDRSSDRAREPGPVDLRRYELNPGWAGIPTFMQTPMCFTPEDLRAAAADVAVLGAPMDCGGGHRGAALGPRAIRSAEHYLPAPAALLNHLHVRLEPFNVLTVVDYGDAAVDPFSIEASMPTIRELVREVADSGAVPIVLGGDHSILWPDAAACADVYGAGRVGVVHFDAHADCSKAYMGHSVTHGEQGMRSHFMAEVERHGLDRVVELAVNEALQGPEYLYLSFDIDVLDPAYAPGTGTPEPGGFTTREMFPVIRRLCHEAHVVGFEVVEVAPNLDHGYTTALNANRVIVEAITGLAMRKQKLPGGGYLDSVTSGDEAFARPRPPANQPTLEDNA